MEYFLAIAAELWWRVSVGGLNTLYSPRAAVLISCRRWIGSSPRADEPPMSRNGKIQRQLPVGRPQDPRSSDSGSQPHHRGCPLSSALSVCNGTHDHVSSQESRHAV